MKTPINNHQAEQLVEAFIKKLESNTQPKENPQHEHVEFKQAQEVRQDFEEMDEAKPKRSHRSNRIAYKTDNKTWMTTFGDLTALMLTFFVMLFALSSTNQAEWKRFSEIMQKHFTILVQNPFNTEITIDRFNIGHGDNIDYIYSLMDEKIPTLGNFEQAQLLKDSQQLILILSNDAQFNMTQASWINEDITQNQIRQITGLLMEFSNHVEVIGFGFDLDIPDDLDRDRAQIALGVERALTISQAMKDMGFPYMIRAGSASSLASISTLAQAQNPTMLADIDFRLTPMVAIIIKQDLAVH